MQPLAPLMAAASADYVIAANGSPRTRPSCTSRAARPGRPRARCTSTTQWSPTTPPGATCSTCAKATCTGAPPIPAGSRARRTDCVAPLTCGVTCIVDECEFDAVRWYDLLEREAVTVWYTAPTALRMLMKAGRCASRGSRPVRGPACGERGRAAQSRGRAVGQSGAGPRHPRHLVADRDGRDHGRQRREPADPARLDGQAGARYRDRPGAARRGRRADRSATRRPGARRRGRRRGRDRPAHPVALADARLPERARAVRRSASPAAGTSRATWPGSMPTGTCGSSAGETTSSSRPGT